MPLDDLPEADRPRERLYFNGPTALADAELLALQLATRDPRRSLLLLRADQVIRVVPLAHRRICGFCGRALALVIPPREEQTERHKLRPECLKLSASATGD